jgi:hypothetical protein
MFRFAPLLCNCTVGARIRNEKFFGSGIRLIIPDPQNAETRILIQERNLQREQIRN